MRPRTGQGRIRSSAFLSPPCFLSGSANKPEPNTAATGTPTISGTPQVGETLTADTSGIADEDGLDNAAFTYQWLADDADISGARGSTYTLVEADEGKTVNLRVSFTDDGGNDETLTSAATDAVAAPGAARQAHRPLRSAVRVASCPRTQRRLPRHAPERDTVQQRRLCRYIEAEPLVVAEVVRC